MASVFCGRPKADDFRAELLSAKSDVAATKERLQVLDDELAKLRSSLGAVCQTRPSEPPADKKGDKKTGTENPPKTEQKN